MARPTDYSEYLRIDDLLELQKPLTPAAPDELLFIVVHQVYELWFRLLLHELLRVRDALLDGAPHLALGSLRRALVIDELSIQQLRLLETMSPDGFLKFRDPLAPASGFQSFQFRAIEALTGNADDRHVDDPGWSDEHRAIIVDALHQPSLYPAFCRTCTVAGLPMPGDDAEVRLASLAGLYLDHAAPDRTVLHLVAELLLDHDEAMLRWRQHHVLMAGREIGARAGTGGSAGTAYLETTLGRRAFPELWAVRSRL
ncbi:MAG: tryptophan 2,3-dioxygenase family protein [Candidatus Dormibacteria bacterium]